MGGRVYGPLPRGQGVAKKVILAARVDFLELVGPEVLNCILFRKGCEYVEDHC